MERKSYTAEFKTKVVLESLQRDTTLEQVCQRFGVSRSWYYERQNHLPDEEEIALRGEFERLILEFPRYGYRRVTRALHRQGQFVNHKRVLRIMREGSLLCHLKKRFTVKTTDSRHRLPVYPNVLAGTRLERV